MFNTALSEWVIIAPVTNQFTRVLFHQADDGGPVMADQWLQMISVSLSWLWRQSMSCRCLLIWRLSPKNKWPNGGGLQHNSWGCWIYRLRGLNTVRPRVIFTLSLQSPLALWGQLMGPNGFICLITFATSLGAHNVEIKACTEKQTHPQMCCLGVICGYEVINYVDS